MQANRQVQRLQLPPILQEKLRQKGFFTVKDVLILSAFELMEILDVAEEDAAHLLKAISCAAFQVPQPVWVTLAECLCGLSFIAVAVTFCSLWLLWDTDKHQACMRHVYESASKAHLPGTELTAASLAGKPSCCGRP